VVIAFILESVTNIAMGTEINSVNEFEDVLCLDPSLTVENGWVGMDAATRPSERAPATAGT